MDDNVRLLVRAVGADDEGGARSTAYWRALDGLQRWGVGREPAPLRLVFAGDAGTADEELLLHFLGQERIRSQDAYRPDERRRIRDGIEGALERCASAAPEAIAVMRRLVAVVLLARHETRAGASRGDALGAVWLAPDPRWTPADHADALWHETVHQALFLEQMVRGLYAASLDRMAGEDGLVTSAIRRARRPYDLAFHAACVASALVDLNHALGRRARCEQLLDGMAQTLPQLQARSAFLSPNGRSILAELAERTAAHRAALAAAA